MGFLDPDRMARVMAIDLRAEAAEGLGVFFLVFAGGAAILAGASPLAVSLVFGCVVAVLVYALGHVCGAHFNPAITVAFAATGHFPWRRVAPYVAAQLLGATVAAFLLRTLFDDVVALATAFTPSFGLARAALVEFAATFLLAFVIIAVATDRRAASGFAGLAIGLTVALNAIWAGPLTGAGTNPARSLGPALAAGHFDALALYLLVPVAGAAAGMLAYEALRPGSKPRPGEALGALGPLDAAEAKA